MLVFAPAIILRLGEASAADFSARLTQFPGLYDVFIIGPINRGDEFRFIDVAVRYKKAIIHLNSVGGNVKSSLAIGAAIYLRQFATSVPPNATCASACALIWLAGHNKYWSHFGRIGFHAAYTGDAAAEHESGSANALIGAYLATLDLPIDFIEFATTAPPTGVRWLTTEDAKRFGLNVYIAD